MRSTGRSLVGRFRGTYRATATAKGPDGVIRTAEVRGVKTKGEADRRAAQMERDLRNNGYTSTA